MKNFLLATACLAITMAAAMPAQAQSGPLKLNCADYQRNPDGSWTPVRQVTINYPNGIVVLGTNVSFPAHGTYMGLELAPMLDQQCPSK